MCKYLKYHLSIVILGFHGRLSIKSVKINKVHMLFSIFIAHYINEVLCLHPFRYFLVLISAIKCDLLLLRYNLCLCQFTIYCHLSIGMYALFDSIL